MRRFQPTRGRVRYHILLYAIAALLAAGCGDDDSSDADGTRTTAFKSNDLREPGESGTLDARACDVLPESFVARSVGAQPGRLEAEPNNSLDLTICEWHGGSARVKLLVD